MNTVKFTYSEIRGGYLCNQPGEQDGEYVRVMGRCGACGNPQIAIRGKYPKGSERTICPTCAVERMDLIRDIVKLQQFAMATASSEPPKTII
jgi:hypothetical protein